MSPRINKKNTGQSKQKRDVDTNQRKDNNVDLQNAEHFFQSVLENSSDIIAIINADGTLRYESPAMEGLFGYSRDEIIGNNAFELIHPESVPQTTNAFEELIKNPEIPVQIEVQVQHKDGSWHTVEVTGKNLLNDPAVNGIIANFHDITDHKNAEKSLQKSEERFRALIENSSDGICILDGEGQMQYVSPTAERVWGYTSEELLSMNSLDFIHPDDLPIAVESLSRFLEEPGSTSTAIYRCRHKNGSWVTAEMVGRNLLHDPNIQGIVVNVRDVTNPIEAAEALKESEERFKAIIENAPDAVSIINPDGSVLYTSPSAVRLSGYEGTDLESNSFMDLIHPDDITQLTVSFGEILENPGNTAKLELRIKHGDGTWHCIEGIGQNLIDNPAVKGIVCNYRDVTDRKLAEEERQKSEETLRRYLESSPDAIYINDAYGNFLYGNKAAEELIGYSREELIGKNFLELNLLPPEYIEIGAKGLEKNIAGKPTGPDEFQLIRKDGTRVSCEISAYPMGQGETMEAIGIARNITDRKNDEQFLRQSEERYRLLADHITDIVFTMDMDLKYTYMSPSVEHLRGFTPEEALSLSMEDSMPPASIEVCTRTLTEELAIEQQEEKDLNRIRAMELEVFCKDGSTIWIEVYVSFLRDQDNNAIGIIGVSRDITDRKGNEDELRNQEEYFRALIENTLDATVILDAHGMMMYASPSYTRILGYEYEQAPGKRLFDHIHPDDVLEMSNSWIQLLANPWSTVVSQCRAKHQDGTWLNIELIGHNLLRHPALNATVINFRDITDRKEAEDEIYRLNEDLERRVVERTKQFEAANKELETFAYSVSHDLRAPLRHIDGFSHMLLEDYNDILDDQGKDYLQRVNSNVIRMMQLIDGILDLSRLSSGEIKSKPVDLSEIALLISMELQEQQPERKVDFIIASGLVVEGDERMLRAVIDNLIRNSWKFTSKHDKARIELGRTEEDGKSVYFVRDDGAGFDMANVEKLFGTFQRLHTTNEFEGTGIGLATVQRIINRHGGDVRAESELEKGATFYFTLGLAGGE